MFIVLMLLWKMPKVCILRHPISRASPLISKWEMGFIAAGRINCAAQYDAHLITRYVCVRMLCKCKKACCTSHVYGLGLLGAVKRSHSIILYSF